ncbi:MAG: F0F1 ATP synthase subunit B family protein [Thermoanaerobaculaceae bacterium]
MKWAISILLGLLWLAQAEAAEGASPTWLGLPVPIWRALNLLAFLGFLIWLLARPLSRFFHCRREEISKELLEAERLRREAAAMQQEITTKTAQLQEEIRALQERLRQEGEAERDRLVAEGEREAARLLQQVDEQARRRLAQAREQLAREAALAAAKAAWELLQREITPADQERIFEATLAKLEAGGEL